MHGDVREPADLLALDPVDAVVECSAEPSALAGRAGDTSYVVDSNLIGARNCLELARRDAAQFVFLSTSRVYPYDALDAAAYREEDTRFELEPEQAAARRSARPACPRTSRSTGPRTLYGATKLAAELLVTEYRAAFGLRTVIDRCGVIAGPWQMGKVDQGVFTHWVLSHYFGRDLSYIGYGGTGKQVRDLLHVDDVVALVEDQLDAPRPLGRRDRQRRRRPGVSLSLLETTEICRELTGQLGSRSASSAEDRPGDVRIYVSDCARLAAHTDWRPRARPARGARGHLRLGPRQRARRARGAGLARMGIAVVTGSGGLIGSESVRHFVGAGYDVIGLENDMRARFFGPDASTHPVTERLGAPVPRVPLARRGHPRHRGRRPRVRRARRRRSSWWCTPPRSPPTTGPPPTR